MRFSGRELSAGGALRLVYLEVATASMGILVLLGGKGCRLELGLEDRSLRR